MEAYICVRLYSVVALVGTEALGNWYGGLGNTRMALIASVLTMVSNVFLNYLLIEPRWGLPGYGAVGAAWASSMATALGFAVLLACFLTRRGHDVPKARLDFRWPELGRMLRFGLPSGINYFLEFAAFALFINVVVGHLGTTTLAAFNIVFQLNMLSFMPAFGVASAGAILVGEAIGRGQPERVRGLTWLSLRFAGGWMLGVGIVYISFPGAFIRLFAPTDVATGQLIEVGVLMLGLSGVWQLFDAITMTLERISACRRGHRLADGGAHLLGLVRLHARRLDIGSRLRRWSNGRDAVGHRLRFRARGLDRLPLSERCLAQDHSRRRSGLRSAALAGY